MRGKVSLPAFLERQLICLDQYTPEISAIDPQSFEQGLQVDTDTKEMLRSLGVLKLGLRLKLMLV